MSSSTSIKSSSERLIEGMDGLEVECVHLLRKFLQTLGVPKLLDAINGLFFASDSRLWHTQIADKFFVSRDSVGQVLEVLRQRGAMMGGEVTGDRGKFFEPKIWAHQLACGLTQNKIHPLAKETRAVVTKLKGHTEITQNGNSEFKLVKGSKNGKFGTNILAWDSRSLKSSIVMRSSRFPDGSDGARL